MFCRLVTSAADASNDSTIEGTILVIFVTLYYFCYSLHKIIVLDDSIFSCWICQKRGFKISSMVEKFNFMSPICLDYDFDFLRVNFLKLFRPAFCSTYSDECFCSFQVFMRFYQCSQSSHSISAIKYHNNNLIWLLNKYGFLTCSCSVLWNGCPKEKSEYISETVCGLILFW